MKASDAKRAAMLVDALGRIDEAAKELAQPACERRPMRILELQASSVDPDDRDDIDIGAWLHIDAATGIKVLESARTTIIAELQAMGLTIDPEAQP